MMGLSSRAPKRSCCTPDVDLFCWATSNPPIVVTRAVAIKNRRSIMAKSVLCPPNSRRVDVDAAIHGAGEIAIIYLLYGHCA